MDPLEISWKSDVARDFSEKISPNAGEKWAELYERLNMEIFQNSSFPLHAAVKLGCERCIKPLLSPSTLNTNEENFTPLMRAIEAGREDILKLLLENGADQKKMFYHFTAADVAIMFEKYSFLPLFSLKEITQLGFRLILQQPEKIRKAVIKALFDQEFKIEGKPIEEVSLSLAFECSEPEKSSLRAIQVFVEAGANVNAKGESGATPLHLAMGRSDLLAADYLMREGADKFAKDDFGNTPLLWGLWKGDPEKKWDLEFFENSTHLKIFALKHGMKFLLVSLKALHYKRCINDSFERLQNKYFEFSDALEKVEKEVGEQNIWF